jgi:broad specificity phosphatase PhoE
VLLIRHAATDPQGRLCGSYDVPLSPAGRREADALLQRDRKRAAPDALLTSTLQRARDVAEVLGRAWNRPPGTAEWAREIDCGDLEGVPLREVQHRFPDLWARHEAQDEETFAWPGGESYAQFRARVLAGLAATAAAHPGARVAVVTHAGVISQVLGVIRGRPASAWSADRPDPLTATEVTWAAGAPATVLSFNDREWY